MVTVVELHDVKAALVYIEVDVPLFKVRDACFPNLCFRVQRLHGLPRGQADILAVVLRKNEEQRQMTVLSGLVNRQHYTATLSSGELKKVVPFCWHNLLLRNFSRTI